MRKLLAILLFIFFVCNINMAVAETVEVGTGEWAPYTSKGMDGFGAFTEIVTAVFDEMGVKPTIDFYPWKRVENLTKEGKLFAAFPYRETEERKPFFDFSDDVMFSTGRFFYLKKKFPEGIPFDTYKDLKPYKIGGIRGYWYEEVFEKEKLNVEYANRDALSFKKLLKKRVDLVPSDELVGWSLIKSLFPDQINQFATIKKPLNQSNLGLMISKKYPGAAELKKRFNASLVRIKEKGRIKEILARHGIQE